MPSIRPIQFQRLVRVFEQDGFRYNRQVGDHLIYTREGSKRPLVIPKYWEAPVFIIKNLLRTAGVGRDRYLEMLRKARSSRRRCV